jgi:hypothetical protein
MNWNGCRMKMVQYEISGLSCFRKQTSQALAAWMLRKYCRSNLVKFAVKKTTFNDSFTDRFLLLLPYYLGPRLGKLYSVFSAVLSVHMAYV